MVRPPHFIWIRLSCSVSVFLICFTRFANYHLPFNCLSPCLPTTRLLFILVHSFLPVLQWPCSVPTPWSQIVLHDPDLEPLPLSSGFLVGGRTTVEVDISKNVVSKNCTPCCVWSSDLKIWSLFFFLSLLLFIIDLHMSKVILFILNSFATEQRSIIYTTVNIVSTFI